MYKVNSDKNNSPLIQRTTFDNLEVLVRRRILIYAMIFGTNQFDERTQDHELLRFRPIEVVSSIRATLCCNYYLR